VLNNKIKNGGEFLYNLFLAAIAPVLICAFYIYIRDKYEKEPIKLLLTGLIISAVLSPLIGFTEKLLERFDLNTMPENSFNMLHAIYISFIISALVEEFFKYLVLYFLIWHNKNFNEPFDGIVYSVMISLGFAMIENILYVINPETGGLYTAFTRAVFSVPGHGFFGVSMGYLFALAKYKPDKKINYLIKALVVPVILHGVFNFILLANISYGIIIFILYAIWLYINGHKKISEHLKISPFKNKI